MTDLDHLEAVARAATPGPWRVRWNGGADDEGHPELDGIDAPPQDGLPAHIVRTDCGYYPPFAPDAAHIAAFNPKQALELITLARRARYFETMIMRCIDVYETQDVDQSHAVDELRRTFDASEVPKQSDRIRQLEAALAEACEIAESWSRAQLYDTTAEDLRIAELRKLVP